MVLDYALGKKVHFPLEWIDGLANCEKRNSWEAKTIL